MLIHTGQPGVGLGLPHGDLPVKGASRVRRAVTTLSTLKVLDVGCSETGVPRSPAITYGAPGIPLFVQSHASRWATT